MATVLYSFSLANIYDDMFTFSFFFEGKPLSGISCLLSTRSAGNMDVQETGRRCAFLKKNGVDPAKTYACSQTHSQTVAVIDENSSSEILYDADGLVTSAEYDSSVYLAVTVADCLPAYIFDTKTGALGVVHSGWKGTGIVLNALKSMKVETHPETVCAVLGPCICGDCYHVDGERRRIFEAQFGSVARRMPAEYPLGNVVNGDCLDLQAANAALLANAGVRNIAYCKNCTFTDERLGSFRREGKDFTKMMAVIGRSDHVRSL
ncbi:MAG: polyphenol oxidase family protein [Treponema sp.]|jgi:YfiH family protein|nr:polyphenol oxidase family protein [Treponema sp.]